MFQRLSSVAGTVWVEEVELHRICQGGLQPLSAQTLALTNGEAKVLHCMETGMLSCYCDTR